MRRALLVVVVGLLAAGTLCAAEPSTIRLIADGSLQVGALAGISILGLMALIAAATLVSEDLTCIAAGLLAAQGHILPAEAVLACFVGIFVGDFSLYWAGRMLGEPALSRPPMRWIVSHQAVQGARLWFGRRGGAIIFITRFMPGTRAATYFTAGALRQHAGKFTVLFGLAAAVWTPLLVLAAFKLGKRVSGWYGTYAEWALPLLALTGALFFLLLQIAIPACTWRGRRRLLGRWHRLTRWEFWPMWAASGPVFFYVLYLCYIRYRQPTLFTVTNPGIPPDSGFIGESKEQIFNGLAGAGDALPAWIAIPATLTVQERMVQLERFMDSHGLDYPVVLKTDEGQRSLGVKVIHNSRQAALYLREVPATAIAQEYVSGPEFGVFYVRMPGDETGRIISITEKHLIHVTGDGRRTLEELILGDARAVSMAPMFLKRHHERLGTVPAAGEQVRLVDTGTHARGALFLNGAHHATPELLAAVDGISKCFEGFYFGRYDLRAPSVEDFRAGRNLKVIELNGLTGQSTHIYDPANRISYCYKVMMAQWRLAFEIGARNVQLGHKPMGSLAFLRHWYRADRRQHEIMVKIEGAEGLRATAPDRPRPAVLQASMETQTGVLG